MARGGFVANNLEIGIEAERRSLEAAGRQHKYVMDKTTKALNGRKVLLIDNNLLGVIVKNIDGTEVTMGPCRSVDDYNEHYCSCVFDSVNVATETSEVLTSMLYGLVKQKNKRKRKSNKAKEAV